MSPFFLFFCYSSLLSGGFLFPSVEQDLSQVLAGSSRSHHTAVFSCPALNPASFLAFSISVLIHANNLHNLNVRDHIGLRAEVCVCVCVCVKRPINWKNKSSSFPEPVQISSHVELCLVQLNLHTLYHADSAHVCVFVWCQASLSGLICRTKLHSQMHQGKFRGWSRGQTL